MHSIAYRAYHFFCGAILFLMSTGLVSNFVALLLLPLAFPLRLKVDRDLFLFVIAVLIIGAAGVIAGVHASFRSVAFPISLIISYVVGRSLSNASLNVFGTFVLLEIVVSIPLWFLGIFSPFTFIESPFSPTASNAHEEFLYYWKTAGLSSNSSLLALKLIVLISIKARLSSMNRRIFPAFLLILPLTMSRTLILACGAYLFFSAPNRFRIIMLALVFAAVGFYAQAMFELISLQFFRGYTGVLDVNVELAENQNRFVYWLYGIEHILSKPIFGSMGESVMLSENSGESSRLHSVFIQLAADYGLMALAFWVMFLLRSRHSLGYAIIPIVMWQAMNQSYLGVFAFADVMLFAAIFSSTVKDAGSKKIDITSVET